MESMSVRERFKAVMEFRSYDRLPVVEWAPWWDKTVDRWHSERLSDTISDRYELCSHFGLDLYKQDWIRCIHSDCPSPDKHGQPRIRNEKDYETILRYLYCHELDREKWNLWAAEQEKGETVIWFTLDGFFWFPRMLFGIEQHLFAFYDQPDLMHRINTDLSEWMIRAIDEICTIATPDFMTFAEDMSYNHGPMLSRQLFEEYIQPYYQKTIPHLKKRGIEVIVDSDGDITEAAPWFRNAGIDGILPLERQAGVDISLIRNSWPEMKCIGHFDKMTMNKGEQAMRHEFERLLPSASQGGFIISCDHQTPPGVSYDDYILYISLFREYAAEAGRISRKNTVK